MSDRRARVHALDGEEEFEMTDLVTAFAALRIQNARAIGAFAATHRISATDLRAVSFISVEGGVTPKQAAEHLGLTTGAMTTLIGRLEAAELVQRGANPADRRSLIVRVTPQGAAMIVESNTLWQRAFQTAFDDAEVPRMREAFLALAAALGEIADSRDSHAGAASE